ncbi:MAG: flavin reductase family protein [Candidatus Saliniplasma sp.]
MKEELSGDMALKFLPHFPTVLIGTGTGEDSNLITAAMIHVFSLDPPMLGTGIAPERHSFKLMEKHRQFTVNVPTTEQLGKILDCGKVSGKDVDKFERFDLTKEKSKNISVPGVKEFPLIFECEVKHHIKTGDHTWFVGEVVNAKKSEKYDRGDTILYWGGEFRKPGEDIQND